MEDCTWLNRLNLRMTYGVGGNVPKNAGPYMTVVDSGYNDWVEILSVYKESTPILNFVGRKRLLPMWGLIFCIQFSFKR